jgi:hypothetical protein
MWRSDEGLAGLAILESSAPASTVRHPRHVAGSLTADAHKGYAVAGQDMTFGPVAADAAKVWTAQPRGNRA